MNPVMSELTIAAAAFDAEITLEARRREALARAAAGAPTGWLATIAGAVRGFVDPRGYALSRVPARQAPPVAMPDTVAPASARPIMTILAAPELAPGDTRPLRAA